MVSDRRGRDALRVLRSVPAMSMAAAHDSAGVPFHALYEALRSLRPRGRCDELAARSATTHAGGAARSPAVGHRALSPPGRRLVPLNALRPGGAQGTAGWYPPRQRRLGALPRAALAASYRSDAFLFGRSRMLLSDCSAVPAAMLWAYVDHPDPNARWAAVQNVGCDVAVVRIVAASPAWEDRWAAARNPKCPPDSLAVLASDDALEVRCRAARHQRSDAATLDALSRDNSLGVRKQVADNPRSAPKTLKRLADDRSVRREVFNNPATPFSTRLLLGLFKRLR